jgi:hypothetical protein
MVWIDLEREALAAAFRTAGPDAATLSTGWATRHLLAHLVQRENQPLANIVDQLSRRPPGEEKHLGRLVQCRSMASARTGTPQTVCGSNGQTACKLVTCPSSRTVRLLAQGTWEWRGLQDAVDARGGSNTVKGHKGAKSVNGSQGTGR